MAFKLVEKIFNGSVSKEPSSAFVWDDFGFLLTNKSKIINIRWADIETIFGYKADCFTFDEICVDIFTAETSLLRLTESTPGWDQFNSKLNENIPGISAYWTSNIITPAFATNMTLLFDRKGRTMEQAEADLYK
ncbi:hypothetical protein [Mucilaginibacter flavus]|uniref:hypothetical protein n=1 Tax=Mucilaginibacter flavus TaxID=931504 RepID=UPI0025B5B1BA|nr:hypothetical protein [Mucilaginibacter flavus]MDN3581223.1 hypothetical protein [Mucilaginibacter flavus]